jgi:hypothetical protein
MPPFGFCAAEGAQITVIGGSDADKTALCAILPNIV